MPFDANNLNKYTVKQLKDWLRSIGIRSDGNKNELILRLQGVPAELRGVFPTKESGEQDEEDEAVDDLEQFYIAGNGEADANDVEDSDDKNNNNNVLVKDDYTNKNALNNGRKCEENNNYKKNPNEASTVAKNKQDNENEQNEEKFKNENNNKLESQNESANEKQMYDCPEKNRKETSKNNNNVTEKRNGIEKECEILREIEKESLETYKSKCLKCVDNELTTIVLKNEIEFLKRKIELLAREIQLERKENEILRKEREVMKVNKEQSCSTGKAIRTDKNFNFTFAKDLVSEFSGQNDSFEHWEMQLRNVKSVFDLDENNMRALISNRLKGKALDWFYSKPNLMTVDVDEFLKEIKQIFGDRSSRLSLKRQFEQRKWQRNEPFQEYYHDKSILANKINIPDDEMVEYLIEGIPNYTLQTQAKMQGFRNKEQMLDAFNKVRLEKSPIINEQLSNVSINGGTQAKQIRCYNCNSMGHMANECRKPKRESGACFVCGEMDHLAAVCRKRKDVPPGNKIERMQSVHHIDDGKDDTEYEHC